jgi:hypothetical protein
MIYGRLCHTERWKAVGSIFTGIVELAILKNARKLLSKGLSLTKPMRLRPCRLCGKTWWKLFCRVEGVALFFLEVQKNILYGHALNLVKGD